MAAAKKKAADDAVDEIVDPTISTESVAGEWAEGTHPARPADEVFHNASRFEYRDATDKPDESTVAQEQIVD
jgi:hypothetical protein